MRYSYRVDRLGMRKNTDVLYNMFNGSLGLPKVKMSLTIRETYLRTNEQEEIVRLKLDTCRNLTPKSSDNGRCYVIIPLTMWFYGCSISISKWTPNPKQLKIGY